MEFAKQSIWVPQHAADDRQAWKVHQAVKRYDENLAFGRNEQTGQWCIFLRQGTSQATTTNDLPVLGFDDIPSVDAALDKLRASDARRRGQDILKELDKHNRSINEERQRAADDAVGEAARAFEWGYRKMGKHPVPRIYVPGKD